MISIAFSSLISYVVIQSTSQFTVKNSLSCIQKSVNVHHAILKRKKGKGEDLETGLLEASTKSNESEIQKLIKQKLDSWKSLKEAGILDKLYDEDGEVSNDTIEEVNKLSSNLRNGIGIEQTKSKKLELSDEGDSLHASNDNTISTIKEKIKSLTSKKGSALALYSILNELKDKKVAQSNIDIVEDVLMALSRQNSSAFAVSGYEFYTSLDISHSAVKTETVLATKSNNSFRKGSGNASLASFPIRFVTSCAAHGLTDASRSIATSLLSSSAATSAELLPAVICTEAYSLLQKAVSFKSKATKRLLLKQQSHDMELSDLTLTMASTGTEKLTLLLKAFRTNINNYSVSEANVVIRVLGKLRMTEEIFMLLDAMRSSGVPPNDESLEFLANAIVCSVEEQKTAKTMAELPSPDQRVPEILFAGRSNVGKSSLVNMLCNRKALASTSATPGHTKAFHFFCVNKDRTDVPSFHIVDVPGMGYAEAANNTQDSWRSLLERYMSVRDPVAAICHLVDSRHKLTTTDKQIINMVTRAAEARRLAGRALFNYVVVLTKTDRSTKADLDASIEDAKKGTQELAAALGAGESGVPILSTSSALRTGRDGLWKVLQELITQKNKKQKK